MSEGKGMYGPIRIWGHCAECRDRKDALKVEVVNVEEEEIYETP